MRNRRIAIPLTLLVALIICGCPASNSTAPTAPTAPEAPNVKVLRAANVALTQAKLGTDILTQLWNANPKQIDEATKNKVGTALFYVADAMGKVTTEAQSTDPWTTMRVKVSGLAAQTAIDATVTDPKLQAAISAINAAVQEIMLEVTQ